MGLRIVHIELEEANDLIARLHRHHKPVVGHRFSLGVVKSGHLVGACVVGRPVARLVDQRLTVEVTRLVTDGTPHACSALYAAAARGARELGYCEIQTYILDSETGTSLRAAGWEFRYATRGHDWNGVVRRGRRTDQPMCDKQLWGKRLGDPTGWSVLPPMEDGPVYVQGAF